MPHRPRDITRLAVAAALGVPALVLLAAAAVLHLEWIGDRLSSAPLLDTRPTLVRLALAAVIVAEVGLAIWWTRKRRRPGAFSDTSTSSDRPNHDASGAPPPAGSPASTAAALFGSVAASIAIMHWSVLGSLGTRFLGLGDSEQHIGLAQLMREEMSVTNPIPNRLSGILSPDGLDAWILDGYGPIWLTAVAGYVVGPVLAYNLVLIATTAANAAAGWLLASRLTADRWLQALCAMSLATAPNLFVRFAGHMNLTWLFTVALIAAEALRSHPASRSDRPSDTPPPPIRIGRLALLFALAYLGSGYFLVIGGLLAAVIFASARPRDWRRTTARLLASGAIAAAILSPWLIARAQFTNDENSGEAAAVIDESLRSAKRLFVADVASPGAAVPDERFVTVPLSDLRRDELRTIVEGWTNPGWVLIAAFGAMLVARGAMGLVVGAGTLLMFVLAIGPVPKLFGRQLLVGPTDMGWLPYTVFDVAPVLSGLRVPGRFGMGLIVVGVIALAASGEWLRRRVARRTFVAVALALLAIIAVTNPRRIGTFPDLLDANDRAAFATVDSIASATDTALVIPNDCRGVEVRYTMLSIHTDVPLVGCHAPHLTMRFASGLPHYVDEPMRSLRCTPDVFAFFTEGLEVPPAIATDDALEALRTDLAVRFLIVHHGPLGAPLCEGVRDRVDDIIVQGWGTPVGAVGAVSILDLGERQ